MDGKEGKKGNNSKKKEQFVTIDSYTQTDPKSEDIEPSASPDKEKTPPSVSTGKQKKGGVKSPPKKKKKKKKRGKKKDKAEWGGLKTKIIDFLSNRPSDDKWYQPKRIAHYIGENPNSVNVVIRRLYKNGELNWRKGGWYSAKEPKSIEEVRLPTKDDVDDVLELNQFKVKELRNRPLCFHGLTVTFQSNKLDDITLERPLRYRDIPTNIDEGVTKQSNKVTPRVSEGHGEISLKNALDMFNPDSIFQRWEKTGKPRHIERSNSFLYKYLYKEGVVTVHHFPTAGTIQIHYKPSNKRGIPAKEFNDFVMWLDNLFQVCSGYTFLSIADLFYVGQIGMNIDYGDGKTKRETIEGKAFSITFDQFEDWVFRNYGYVDDEGEIHGRVEGHLKAGAFTNQPLFSFLDNVRGAVDNSWTQQLAMLTNKTMEKTQEMQEKQANALNYELQLLRKEQRDNERREKKTEKLEENMARMTEMLDSAMKMMNKLNDKIEKVEKKVEGDE